MSQAWHQEAWALSIASTEAGRSFVPSETLSQKQMNKMLMSILRSLLVSASYNLSRYLMLEGSSPNICCVFGVSFGLQVSPPLLPLYYLLWKAVCLT